jgi:hypothetical protein
MPCPQLWLWHTKDRTPLMIWPVGNPVHGYLCRTLSPNGPIGFIYKARLL